MTRLHAALPILFWNSPIGIILGIGLYHARKLPAAFARSGKKRKFKPTPGTLKQIAAESDSAIHTLLERYFPTGYIIDKPSLMLR